MGDKAVEDRCLNIAKHLSSDSRLNGIDCRAEQERPDFVFNKTGIEHFITDIIFPKGE